MPAKSETNISAPIVWVSDRKFVVQDLRENYFEDVITLLKHHYLSEEPLCRSTNIIRDRVSANAYLDRIRSWMRDTCSLVAVSKKSGRVVGAAIVRMNSFLERTNTYSRVLISDGQALESIMHLKNALVEQANIYETIEHDTYLRLYVLCVHPSYRKKGVGRALLESCFRFAWTMKIPAIGGIFTSTEEQLMVEKFGFAALAEIPYNNWLVDEEVVFENPGPGNYSAVFMAMPTPNEDTLNLMKKAREKGEVQKKK
ncbi:hypothetical protein QAD02_008780 [Eretmocerus hayati]|uniref:Uncharacterized protein n=1 Tax=Eretmocerus hayati TaxID=131215 RepID=A0ACC2N7J6_9HYME|nr:hypothetical protein QAD02_008780 [Eretmocerus hayati]